MAFDSAITEYFPNATTDYTGIFIPYTDFESYDYNTKEDIRQLVYSFNKAISDIYEALDSADKSNAMTVSSSQGFISNDTVRKNFSLNFNLDLSGTYSVSDE